MAASELSDAEIFGGPARELSDADVFAPAPKQPGLGGTLRALAADFLSPLGVFADAQRRRAHHGVMADYAPGGPLYEPPTFASDMSARKRALQNPVTPATLAQAGARARLDAPSIGPTDASMPRSGGAVAAIAAAPGQAYRYLAGSGAKGVRILAELAGDPESTDYATQRARNIDHRTAMVEASLSSQGRVSPLTVSRGFGQALTQAPTMAAGLWAKAPFAIAGILGFAMPAAAHAYHDLRESGLDASLALPGAIGKGLLEYATELPTFKVLQKMPLPRVVDAFRGDAQALGQLVRYHAVSNGIEFGTEEVSTAGDWLIDRALKDPTATLERLGHDMKQTAAQMAVQAPATAGMGHAMRRAPDVARAVTDRVMPQRALGRALDEAVTTTQFTDPAGPALARMQPRGEISDREVFGPSVPAVAPPTRVAVPSQPPAPATQQASAQAPTGASPAQPNPAQAPATTETPRPDIQAILARVMGRQGAAEALESQQPDRQAVQPAPTPQAPQDLPQQPTAPAPLPRPSAVIAPAQERATPLAAAPTPQTQRTAGAVLQNRDRSSDASITQMNAIAGNPDPARLSISRTMDSGAPIVFANADLAPAGAMGREDVAVDAAGKRVKVRYAVVEADSVLASHRVDGTARPEYTSDATPGRLRAINNGRTAGLQAAYERGTAGAYREGIAQDAEMLGIDPRQMAAMRAPMLVRIMSAADVTADIGDRSNAPQVASLSAVEHAANDARRIALPDLRFAEDGSPSADALRQFVQAMPAQEQAELAPNGVPTAQAEDRLLGAVFHQAYGPQLTELYAQAADPEAKGVLRALAIAAPDMAALEGAGEYDIRDAVRDAAQAFVSGRRRNIRSADIAAQADLTLSSDARNVLELLARGFRRPQAIGAILADAARFARAQAEAPEGDMFGAVPRAGRAAVFERIAHETETGLGNTSGRGPPSPAPVRGESGAAEPESGYGGRDLSPDRAEGRAQPVERGTGEPVASESDARSPEPDRSDPADVERYVNQQIDLFVDGGPLFQRESGARPDSGARGQEARAAAAASIRSWNLRSPGAILARAIATSLVARGRASLEGQIVRTAEELAFLAQIYRDPRFETLRYFLVDASGRVVGQFGISSRLPTSTTAFLDDPDQFISKLDHRMRAAGAVGYWMLHNHPSGFAEASNADLRTTHYIARRLAGFRGHVIIDHDEFSLIKRDGDFEDHIPMGHGGQDPLRQKAPGLGNIISSPGALAFMGRDLVRTDAPVITVIGTDAQRRTTAVGEIPVSQLDTPKKRQWTMRRWALHTGSVNLFAVGAAEHSSTLLALGRDKLVMDAVHYVPDARLDQPKAISAAENRLFEGGNEGIYPANRRTRGTSDTSPMFADMRPGPAARRQQQGVSEPDFVQAPDGSPDFGEITPEMGRAMRRQAGPIRLERGEHRSDGTGHGLVHIEAGHGRQIRNAGYASVQDFVATVSRGFTRVYQTRARQLLLARVNGQQDVLFIQLEPTTEGGDYYRVNTAFPASRNYLEKQLERGAVLLWDGSEPTSAAAGQQPPYAGTPESSPDQGVPIARGESNGDSLPQGPDRVESPQTPYNTTPRRAQRTIGADGLSPAIHTYLASQRTAIPDRKTVGHVNYDKINSPEAVKLELAKLSDAYETQIAVARRGRVSVDATARLADLLGQSPARMAKLVRRKTSEASNAHELVARASLLEGSAEHLAKLMDEVAKNPTEENARAMIAQVERSAMMSAQFLGAAAEAGRALNILRNLNTATRQAERLRETADLIKDWGGLDNIRELAQRIQEYDTPQQLLGFAREQARSQAPSMWLEAWKAGLLSGPTTHLANILSNTITLGLRIPEKAITAMIGMAHGGEKAYMTEALAETLGMVMGVRSAARAAWHTFKTGDTAAEDKTEVRGKAITGANLGLTGGAAKAADLVGETVRIPFRFLSTEDAFFKELHRQMTLYALATRAAIAEKSKKPFQRIAELAHDENDPIRERADQDALYFTFNKRLGLAGETFMRLVNTPGARWMQLIVPFIRTPTNIIKFAGERTPFAVLSKNVRNDLAAGGVARDEAIAKMVVGSALGLTAFSFAMEGLLSGGGPPEPERKRLLRERGWQPYSIKVGDTWHAYNRLEPLGILLGVAADGAEIWDYLEEDEREKLGAMIGIAVAQNLTSKTWLRGISDVVNALSNPGRYGDRYIANLAGTLIPTGLAQAARANDPIVRETEGMDAGGDPILREAADIIAKWKSRIPGMSEELQPRLDTWGEPVQREGGLGGAFSPIAVSREKADPVRDEAVRLKLEIKLPEKKLYDVKLSPEQRTMYGTLSGQTAHQVLSQVVTSDGYQRLPDWAKREMVSEIVSEVRSGAREIMMPEIGPETIVEKRLKRYEARP